MKGFDAIRPEYNWFCFYDNFSRIPLWVLALKRKGPARGWVCENRPLMNLKFWKESHWYCKGNGNVTFIRPFLMLDKLTFDKHVNVLERYCKADISYTFTKPLTVLFPKLNVLKCLILHSVGHIMD